jgi:hypothetical protein
MAATVAMDMTILRVPVDLAARAAMAAPSATEGMADTEEADLVLEVVRLLAAVVAVPGVTEVPPAATAVPAEREERQPSWHRVPTPSAGPVEPEDSAGH